MNYLPTFVQAALLALGQSYDGTSQFHLDLPGLLHWGNDWPNAREVTLKDMGKISQYQTTINKFVVDPISGLSANAKKKGTEW